MLAVSRLIVIAARFSRRWAMDDVPAMTSVCGDKADVQAIATWAVYGPGVSQPGLVLSRTRSDQRGYPRRGARTARRRYLVGCTRRVRVVTFDWRGGRRSARMPDRSVGRRVDAEGAEVVVDALAEFGRLVVSEDTAFAVAAGADLADQDQPGRVGMQGIADQLVTTGACFRCRSTPRLHRARRNRG